MLGNWWDLIKGTTHPQCVNGTASCWNVASVTHEWVLPTFTEWYTGKPRYSEKHLSQCHFAQHKFQKHQPGTETGHPIRGQPPQNSPKAISLHCSLFLVSILQNPVCFLALQFFISLHHIREASNIYQFHLHPHFPKPFLCDAKPIKSVRSTVVVWILEALNITPKALYFLPSSVITL
jgi:hypothetical protein